MLTFLYRDRNLTITLLSPSRPRSFDRRLPRVLKTSLASLIKERLGTLHPWDDDEAVTFTVKKRWYN
jgi:hypothetical protein